MVLDFPQETRIIPFAVSYNVSLITAIDLPTSVMSSVTNSLKDLTVDFGLSIHSPLSRFPVKHSYSIVIIEALIMVFPPMPV